MLHDHGPQPRAGARGGELRGIRRVLREHAVMRRHGDAGPQLGEEPHGVIDAHVAEAAVHADEGGIRRTPGETEDPPGQFGTVESVATEPEEDAAGAHQQSDRGGIAVPGRRGDDVETAEAGGAAGVQRHEPRPRDAVPRAVAPDTGRPCEAAGGKGGHDRRHRVGVVVVEVVVRDHESVRRELCDSQRRHDKALQPLRPLDGVTEVRIDRDPHAPTLQQVAGLSEPDDVQAGLPHFPLPWSLVSSASLPSATLSLRNVNSTAHRTAMPPIT